MRSSSRLIIGMIGATLVTTAHAFTVVAQDPAGRVVRLEASPSEVVVTAGETTPLRVTAYDAAGRVVNVPVRVAGPRQAVRVSADGVTGLTAGAYELVALVFVSNADREPVQLRIPVTVRWPPVARVEIDADPGRLYQGTTLRHRATALHADGSVRPDAVVNWETSLPAVATVNAFGHVRARNVGNVTITATVEGVRARVDYQVAPLPAASIDILGGQDIVRTGDVQRFAAQVRGESGTLLEDVPVTWSHSYAPTEGVIAPSAPGQLDGGKMVTDVPGVYTVIASAGPVRARKSFEVARRDVLRRVEIVGHGRQDSHYTSDLWVFEGVDGRDYALTGARQSQSHGFVWDVTDPTNIFKTDSIKVDARSLNDVKVSPDGRYAALSREGASNRRNGVVLLDLSVPAHPTVATTYDEGLTGGVHNVFATNDYLFALSNGDKYVIIDVRDVYNPRYVSEYDHPNSRIHDVWVHDGVAYSAEWGTGVVVVDVGNGRWGGSIDAPKLVTTYPLPSGQTHAVFPYYQEATGTFYLFAGDEITNRRGMAWEGTGPDVRMAYDPETGRGGYPRVTSGYIQVINFSDPEHPEMVARYEVTEYGTHNIWVEDDILYQAYYEGGMRLVDVSGELMGNLYTQNREIAVFKAFDPAGWIKNAPAAWGVQPHKGHIFFSDISSGIWAMRLVGEEGS